MGVCWSFAPLWALHVFLTDVLSRKDDLFPWGERGRRHGWRTPPVTNREVL